jgi:hypothetical protein
MDVEDMLGGRGLFEDDRSASDLDPFSSDGGVRKELTQRRQFLRHTFDSILAMSRRGPMMKLPRSR